MAGSEWIIIELSELGETLSYAELENAILETFGDIDYFIPVHHEKMGSYISTSTLFEGYVFIKDHLETRSRLIDLHDTKAFTRVLGNRGRIQTVDSRTIGVLRRKLKKSIRKKIKEGTPVKILDGVFADLTGEVMSMEDGGTKALVRIKRLSREMIAPIPTTSIMEIEGAIA